MKHLIRQRLILRLENLINTQKKNNFFLFVNSLRKVKMDQRKLMDNANTITDMAKVSILSGFYFLFILFP